MEWDILCIKILEAPVCLQEYGHPGTRTEPAHQVCQLLSQAQEHISGGGAAQHSDQLPADVVQGAQ